MQAVSSSFVMTLDPVAFFIGSWPVRWYALAYIVALITAYYVPQRRAASLGIQKRSWCNCVDIIFLSGLIGGRLGQGIFYDAAYWYHNPWEVIYIWHGGMSFFGAIIGGCVGIMVCSRIYHVTFYTLSDIVCSYLPIGLGLGRLANMLNSECIGRVTKGFGIIFPVIDNMPRYPTQLWEALSEGLVLFFILRCIPYEKKGRRTIFFIISYSIIRLIVEPFKEYDSAWYIGHTAYNPSIILALCILCMGIILWSFRIITMKK